jgi:REP element-mobilizing transposase RayT
MAIKWKQNDSSLMYFCTFTCYDWLCLFELINGYDLVYKWFDVLKDKEYYTVAFVVMPNHVHLILYFPKTGFDLNKIMSNGKRFMAYDIIKRLEQERRQDILDYLAEAVSERERKKGQLHKVFTDSFDAKGIYTEKFFNQKLNYIHLNPVRGKWQLVDDYTKYEHSSASFYETGEIKRYEPFDFRLL